MRPIASGFFLSSKGVWYPEAIVLADTATGSIGTPIYDTRAYLMKNKADGQALVLAKV